VAVERVADMRRRAYRHVAIDFATPVDVGEFAGLPGVTRLEAQGAHVTFRVQGPLDPVVKAAARHTVVDMELTEPSLEELFLAFYGHAEAS
jgi:ABC-2 type transport system ATP-binding protein